MKRVFSQPLIFALFLTSALAQNNTPTAAAFDAKELTGEYIWSTGVVGASYELRGDGSFEYHTFSDCCDPVWKETGSYTLSENVLHFKVRTKTLNGNNMLDPKLATDAYRKVYNNPDAKVPADQLYTEYELQVVRWGERLYLFAPELLPQFAAAVNFGIEPRHSTIEENYLSALVYLRSEDDKKAIVGQPSLPEPWLSLLKGSAIKATIIKVERQNNERIYTVDKGSADGLKVGMILVKGNEKPDSDNVLVVTTVEEGSATMKHLVYYNWTEPCRMGDTIRTKPDKKQQ